MSEVKNPNSEFGYFDIKIGELSLMLRGDDDYICIVPSGLDGKEHAYVPMAEFKAWLNQMLEKHQPHA